jgi:hypothetical protein
MVADAVLQLLAITPRRARPTTFASNGLFFSAAYYTLSRHSQRNGNKYVPS